MIFQQMIPQHWKQFFEADLLNLDLGDSRLDCLRCPKQETQPSRCCDHFPFVANFYIDDFWSGEKREIFEEWWGSQNIILPIGLIAPAGVQIQKLNGQLSKSFRCPFLTAENLCSIWSKRPGECAGYWCEKPSANYSEKIKGYLNFVEQGLSQCWMLEAGFDIDEIETNMKLFSISDSSESALKLNQRQIWAHHFDDPKEYFKRAKNWFRNLNKKDLKELLGEEEVFVFNNLLTSLQTKATTKLDALIKRPSTSNHK